jgi:hypothetical protein
MKPENNLSPSDLLFEGVTRLLSPAGETFRLQKEWNVQSLDETAIAAERAGCEVCYVDLPERVSGFADIIDGKAHIVLNRSKSRQNLEYTLPHELGHCALHLNPSRDGGYMGLLEIGTAEFQADLFAVIWVNWLGNDRQRKEMLAENRESSTAVVMGLLLTLALIAVAIIAWLFSKQFDTRRLAQL